MKKILLSVITIGVVAAVAFGASQAWFSDTEVSTGNTFTTGTIDIAVDGENPWDSVNQYALNDMKPSQTDYIDFVVHNVGGNPVNLWKKLIIDENNETTGKVTEPECVAEGGTWSNNECTGNTENNHLSGVINYDLRVELYKEGPGPNSQPVWWETIYMDSDNIKLASLPANGMYLGMIPAGWYLKVMQSYHMPSNTGNEYQGDQTTFDIELYAEQLTNTIVLENKYLANTDVSHHVWDPGGVPDGKDATLTYKVKDREFDYVLDVKGMANGPYTLVTWEDNTYAWTWGNFAGTTVLAHITVSGSPTHAEDSIDLGKDLTNSKVWLVPGTLGTLGQTGVTLPWNPTNTLFETGLIDYYDADL